eukprot:7656927-Pyramimonas_sp.AAC.1
MRDTVAMERLAPGGCSEPFQAAALLVQARDTGVSEDWLSAQLAAKLLAFGSYLRRARGRACSWALDYPEPARAIISILIICRANWHLTWRTSARCPADADAAGAPAEANAAAGSGGDPVLPGGAFSFSRMSSHWHLPTFGASGGGTLDV